MESCLVAKLSHYVDLDDRQERMLARLEESTVEHGSREEIYSGGDDNKYLYVVKSGWLYGYTDLPDGGRHVVRIYHAGDIIGLPGLAYNRHHVNLKSANRGALCPFEKRDLDEIIEEAPRITALLFTLSSREQVILIDMLRASSRMAAKARLAYLFLDILCRLRITNPGITDRMQMPLTQTDIGDAVGLTNVTVSRAMSELQRDGFIERQPGALVITDEDRLRELCDFTDRHREMDTSWFPGQ